MYRIVQILENIEHRLTVIEDILSQGNTTALPITTKKKRAENGINLRLLQFLSKNPDAMFWTARRLASALDCSKSAIIQSDTWKRLILHLKTKTKTGFSMEKIADF